MCLLVCFRLSKAIWSILPVTTCLFKTLSLTPFLNFLNFENFALSPDTFLKFLTLKFFVMSPDISLISQLYRHVRQIFNFFGREGGGGGVLLGLGFWLGNAICFSNFQLLKFCHYPRHVSQIFNFKNFCHVLRHVFEIFYFKKFAMLCRTFIIFFLIQKFCHVLRQFPHFTNLSTCLLHFQLLLGGGVCVCVCGGGFMLGLRLGI